MVILSHNKVIFLFNLLTVHKDKVDEDRPGFAIKRDCVSIIVLAYHLRFRHTGHLLNGPVPGDDLFISVNSECCIRQKIYYDKQLIKGILHLFLCPLSVGYISDDSNNQFVPRDIYVQGLLGYYGANNSM